MLVNHITLLLLSYYFLSTIKLTSSSFPQPNNVQKLNTTNSKQSSITFSASYQQLLLMAQKIEISLVLAIVAMFWAGTTAQSSCTNVLVSMSPCLNYITGNSSTPSSGCCSQLARVVRSQPQCLCEVLNGGGSPLGININKTQAMALPGACNVQTPPLSRCNGKNTFHKDLLILVLLLFF